jgi:hypothetical protein
MITIKSFQLRNLVTTLPCLTLNLVIIMADPISHHSVNQTINNSLAHPSLSPQPPIVWRE